MRSRKQPNKVKPYTSRQNQNINHNGSNYNNTYDNSNTGSMSQHSNNNSNNTNNKQNYNNMYQQQQQPPQYQLMMTNSMMQIQSKQTKQTQPKEKESTDVNETNNNNTLPNNKKQIYHQQIPRGTYNNNKNQQFQYKEHHHHPHYQQNHQQQQQNNSLSNSDSLNLSMSSETTSQQAQPNQPLSRNSFMSERSSAPPPNYATFTPTYIINDPSFMSNYPLPINMYNPQSNIQMNQGKFPPFALGQNPQGNAGQVGVGQQKKPKAQVKGNQPQNIMLNMNYNNMIGIPFPIGVNNAVNMKNNWNAQQQQQQQQQTTNKNMPFNQGVANTPSMQNIMNNVMLNNNNSSNNSNVLQQHQQIKTNNNKHHFMPFPRTVHSDKCIITTPDIFGKNYKQQYTNTNDSNTNSNSTLHTQNKQIFNTINIKLKLPTNNNTSSSPIHTEFKLNLNDDIHKAINTHILTNNIDPKYTDAIYQKVLKGINLLTSVPETKLPKTSLKTLHDIHNLNTLLSTTNISTDSNDINNTILDANTSFSYLIESTQYEKYISSLKPTTPDYERYHKLTYSI